MDLAVGFLYPTWQEVPRACLDFVLQRPHFDWQCERYSNGDLYRAHGEDLAFVERVASGSRIWMDPWYHHQWEHATALASHDGPITLSPEGEQRLVAALQDPSGPTPAMVELFRKYGGAS